MSFPGHHGTTGSSTLRNMHHTRHQRSPVEERVPVHMRASPVHGTCQSRITAEQLVPTDLVICDLE